MYREPAQEKERRACQNYLCKNKIHSQRDFNLAAVAIKKQLRNEGIAAFENDARYLELLRCKQESDKYPDANLCKILLNTKPAPQYQYQPPPPPQPQPQPRPQYQYKAPQSQSKYQSQYPKSRTWNDDDDAEDWDDFDNRFENYQDYKNKKSVPMPMPCPPGKERNPITKRCRTMKNKASPKTKKTKKASLSPKKASPKHSNSCKSDEEINPANGRCRKVCPIGTERYAPTGRCRKI